MNAGQGKAVILAFCAVLLACVPAHANIIAPFMGADITYLTVGCVLLGLVEGLALAAFFRLRAKWAILTMVVANFCSAYAGIVLAHRDTDADGIALYDLKAYLVKMTVAALLLTALIEWPFILFLLRKARRRLVRSAGAALAVQILTYGLIIALYWRASSLGMLTETTLEKDASFVTDRSAVVYYTDFDRHLCKVDLDGSGRQRILDLPEWGWLVALPNDSGSHDLVLSRRRDEEDVLEPLLKSFADLKTASGRDPWGESSSVLKYRVHPDIIDLRPDDERRWNFSDGNLSGLRAESPDARVSFGLMAPFVWKHVHHVTVLAGDEMVFVLDYDICVMQFASRKVAVLARGRNPVVVPSGSLIETPAGPPRAQAESGQRL